MPLLNLSVCGQYLHVTMHNVRTLVIQPIFSCHSLHILKSIPHLQSSCLPFHLRNEGRRRRNWHLTKWCFWTIILQQQLHDMSCIVYSVNNSVGLHDNFFLLLIHVNGEILRNVVRKQTTQTVKSRKFDCIFGHLKLLIQFMIQKKHTWRVLLPAVCHTSFMYRLPKKGLQRTHLCVLAHSSSHKPSHSSLLKLHFRNWDILWHAETDFWVTGRRMEEIGDEEAKNSEMRRAPSDSVT